MSESINIDAKRVGDGEPVFVIAEIGINHNGDSKIAMEMIDAIADSGADCVKFQTFSAEEFVNNPDEMFEYVSQGKPVKESMLEMFKRNELARSEFEELFTHARKRGLIPLSTPTDRDAVDLLEGLGVGAFKIGSDDLVYTPFLRYVAQKQKPIIISTGMANESDVRRAVEAIRSEGNDQIAILHCVSEYPTPPANVNLRKINTISSLFDLPVGFSDHSWGYTSALGAVAMGACIVEKHFTLDRDMAGPDHHFSADPKELTEMVKRIRELELNFGSDELERTSAEGDMALLARRSIIAVCDLPAGKPLSFDDFAFKRPGTGLLPYEVDGLVGKVLKTEVSKGSQITFMMID